MEKGNSRKSEKKRNEGIFLKIDGLIKSGTMSEEQIAEAGKTLDLLSRWESLAACEDMCRFGLWDKVGEVLPSLGYPNIGLTEKNIHDYIIIELKALNRKLDDIRC